MAKDYSKSLQQLKKMLPYGYQGAIAKSIADCKSWHVKHAFSGRTIRADLLKKIYNKAARMARQRAKNALAAKNQVKAIKKLHRHAA